MLTLYQIKKEICLLMRRGPYGPAAHDVVNEDALNKLLFSKYAGELSNDEFNRVGDELADSGDFYWNDDGKLALSPAGFASLDRV